MVIILAFVSGILIYCLIRQSKEKLSANNPTILRLKKIIYPVFPEISKIKILNHDSSFTINKEKIYLCTVDKKSGKIYDDNMLIFVLLHELAHVKAKEVGHGKEFWKIFNDILIKATEFKIWDPSKPRITNYCV